MGSSGIDWKLPDHPKLPKGKVIGLIVLDGWGEANADQYNCIHVAETPVMDSLKKGAPERWRLVRAHGTAVGLPTEDDMGNSEVGHNALGAGRIFAQGAKLVDAALASGKMFEGEGFKYIKESFATNTLHLIGLMSDGGVHSRLDQLLLLLKGASEQGAKRIRVHVLTDGRDVLDGSSVGFAEILENDLAKLREKGVDAQVASGGGRMYVTMDRYENDWSVVKRGWDAQVLGEAPFKFKNVVEAIKTLRAEPKANDQYLPPFVIVDDSGKPVGPIVDGDAVVTFNFRADRMVMLAKALEYADFDKFDRVRVPKIRYAGMLQYDGELKLPSKYLVEPPEIDRTSGEYLTYNGVRTFACSETVKFGHVTFFWNGNRSGYFNDKMEEYVEIPSDSGITFNVQPKMKAIVAQVASGGGRMYVTMDRYENDWSVVKRGWDAQALGEAIKTLTAEPVPIALTALDSPELTQGSAMRLVGHSDKLPIQVLVDSGADLNFLNPSVALRLGLCIDHSLMEPVAVANGDICYTQGIAHNFTVKLQDYTFCSDIRLLSVQGCDLVLGAEWLETLGFIGWHFRHKVMEFQIEGHNYRLVGLRSLDSPPTLPPPPFDSSMPNIDSLLASLLSASSPPAAAHPIPPPLTSLLDAPFDNPLWPTLVI